MVNHIVLWNFREDLSDAEKKEAAVRMKKELEAIKAQVPGTVSLQVVTDTLSSSNKDIGLISVFETEEALQSYQKHPAHIAAAAFVGSVTEGRVCLDYES